MIKGIQNQTKPVKKPQIKLTQTENRIWFECVWAIFY